MRKIKNKWSEFLFKRVFASIFLVIFRKKQIGMIIFAVGLFLSLAINQTVFAEAGAPAPGTEPAPTPAGIAEPAKSTPQESKPECNSVCEWIKANYGMSDADYQAYQAKGGIIPQCAFSGTCRETNDLVQMLVNQGRTIFGIIGMVALVAFVYGGFLMVFSFGSPDKVTQGKDVMIAAVIGIIIVFSAYLIVNFILDAIGVSEEFQAIK